MGCLTTHVLDTVRGRPAEGVTIEVHRISGTRQLLKILTTNSEGRCDAPLLDSTEFEPGLFELSFHVGSYFRAMGMKLAEPVFLGEVIVRIGIAADESHHVPLLISPWSYSVYRGC
jgi:5-hydroxyisourate hydrolase